MGVVQKLFTPANTNPDEVRMTLGEHLEELRIRLIKALIALAIGAIICYVFIDYIQAFLCWPVYAVYHKHGYDPAIRTFSPSESFFTDMWVAVVVGLIVSAPYSITQIWGFVAAGLYPNERKWVRGFAPVSIALFFAGALFLIIVVNPILMDFLLGYRTELPDIEKAMPAFLIKSSKPDLLPVAPQAASQPAAPPSSRFAIQPFDGDAPANYPEGMLWLNRAKHELRVRYASKTYVIAPLQATEEHNRIVPEMRFSEVIPFTLGMAGAFGLGFQVPVVVAFLATIGVFSAKEMASYRKHVILVMAFVAAVVTPPDPASQLFLLVPMVGLFEAGLFAARAIERKRAEREAEPA